MNISNLRKVIYTILIISISQSASVELYADEGVDDWDRFRLFNFCSRMGLWIDLDEDAARMKLTENSIQVATESRLRSARIYRSESYAPALDVSISLVGNAFSIRVRYYKFVFDPITDLNFATATWGASMTGTHTEDPSYIISSLSEVLDAFLVDYLRVNEKYCT